MLPVTRAAFFACLVVLASCGHEPPRPGCTVDLTYETFGALFVANWCRGCHSSQLPLDMRQNAPTDVNFDSAAEVRARAERIRIRAGTGMTMPPAGGPSADERALLVEWLDCGAP